MTPAPFRALSRSALLLTLFALPALALPPGHPQTTRPADVALRSYRLTVAHLKQTTAVNEALAAKMRKDPKLTEAIHQDRRAPAHSVAELEKRTKHQPVMAKLLRKAHLRARDYVGTELAVMAATGYASLPEEILHKQHFTKIAQANLAFVSKHPPEVSAFARSFLTLFAIHSPAERTRLQALHPHPAQRPGLPPGHPSLLPPGHPKLPADPPAAPAKHP